MSVFVPGPALQLKLLNSLIHGGHGQAKCSSVVAAPPVPEAAPEQLPTFLHATESCLLGLGGRRRRGRPLRRR